MDEREQGSQDLYTAYAASHQIPRFNSSLDFCVTWWGISEEERHRFRVMYDRLQQKKEERMNTSNDESSDDANTRTS